MYLNRCRLQHDAKWCMFIWKWDHFVFMLLWTKWNVPQRNNLWDDNCTKHSPINAYLGFICSQGFQPAVSGTHFFRIVWFEDILLPKKRDKMAPVFRSCIEKWVGLVVAHRINSSTKSKGTRLINGVFTGILWHIQLYSIRGENGQGPQKKHLEGCYCHSSASATWNGYFILMLPNGRAGLILKTQQ